MRICFWRQLRTDGHMRERWEAGLSWFRLRYVDGGGLRRAIRLLSSAQACGRVALCYLPDETVSRLYLGVPGTHDALLKRMSADRDFMIRRVIDWQPPPAMPMAPVERLPWDRAFYAHIVESHLFLASDGDGQGVYLPQAPRGMAAPDEWHLPQPAPAGLSLQPSWNGQRAPAGLRETESGSGWPLGHSCHGALLLAGPRVNVYGSGDAAADWLARLVEHLLREETGGLVVLDGKGDLVPNLKRKTAVTRLLGVRLTYVDIDGAAVTGGFNPLAATPGENEVQTLQRWQRWFGSMGVHREGVRLLGQARVDGVADIAALQRWLHRPTQQPFAAAVSSLQVALRRLQGEPVVREWLSWPTNIFTALPQGNLLLSCREVGWARQQLLRAALLAALSLREARLIVHGFPWTANGFREELLEAPGEVLLSNGPRLQESDVVLARTDAPGAEKLSARFLRGDALGEEHIQLLRPGEAMVVYREGAVCTRWN